MKLLVCMNSGADPNGGNHEHNYTCLHFAGLAGKAEVCSLLLEAGAKTYHTNSVNRSLDLEILPFYPQL